MTDSTDPTAPAAPEGAADSFEAPEAAAPPEDRGDGARRFVPFERSPRLEDAPGFDPVSAMTPRLGVLASVFARRFFGGFRFEPGLADRLRKLEARGAVVYVMRYSSRLDYLLFNWLFLREGIRLSLYANGVQFFYYRPVPEALRTLVAAMWERLGRGRAGARARRLAHVREILQCGGSLFVFLRTDKLGARLQPKPQALASASREIDQLREIVATAYETPADVSLVPLAIFWRKGATQSRRFLDVLYGSANRPTTTWKLFSFLWSYKNLTFRAGEPIDLRRFIEERRADGVERAVRQLRRALLIFLRREEKPVLGPALRPRLQIEEVVLRDPHVQQAIQKLGETSKSSVARAEQAARRYIREVAAHPSPTMLAILDVLVDWAFRRLFARIEVIGLERVVEAAKLHPLVLIPSHRSHFDYLILSWLFYESHLVPPLVAAGANLIFFPVGTIFRRAGAFFLRRSFDGDELYTAVFRSYVQLLIKDGVTQEFFIEGTRSRTGKTLQPRTGLMGMILDAFRRGARRDLYVIPVGFTYERLVEESAMTGEKRGAEKKPESALGLFRARSVLKSRFGAVSVRFGEPISLAHRTGLERKPDETDLRSGPRSELHDLSRRLGLEICRQINALISAERSAISAAALLGGPTRGTRLEAFVQNITDVARAVQLGGQPWSTSLERVLEGGHSLEAADLLLQEGIVERRPSPGGDILSFSETSRESLVYYRATILPSLAWSAILATTLLAGARTQDDALREASSLLGLLRIELFPPEYDEQRTTFERVLSLFQERGWVRTDTLGISRSGRGRLRFFAAQLRPTLESYQAVFEAVAEQAGPAERRTLLASAKSRLEEQLLLGEALYSEAVCSTTMANALQLLLEEEALVAEGNPRRPEAMLSSGPRAVELEALRERVARVLAAG